MEKAGRILALGPLTLRLAGPALAILGLGDIVFDPTSYGELVQQFLQMQQEYRQLVQTYEVIQSQYQQMLWMAQRDPVNMLARYRALPTPWFSSSATNTYGTSGGWIAGINTGLGVIPGTQRPHSRSAPTARLSAIFRQGLSRIQTNYATVELTDGANLSGMQNLGVIRANAPAVETTIQNLGDGLALH